MAAEQPAWFRELQKSSAAQWVRCALQVNPFEYAQRYGAASAFASESDYNEALVRSLQAAEVEVIAVTDHYRATTSETLVARARSAGITAFPGFEASTAEGAHFLCFFEEETTTQEIERKIGMCGVELGADPSPIGEITALELLRRCAEWRAGCVAAHVTRDNGLLAHLHGQTRLRAWKSQHLHAVAIPGAVADVEEPYLAILENNNSDYRRARPPAVLNAGDVSAPTDVSNSGASCLLKLSDRSLEAVRQAFLDPESRVRLNSDAMAEPPPRLVGLHWTGGFLDGQTIRLADELNVLVGAPGAGKSTLIESVRCAYGLSAVSDRARRDHVGIRDHVLGKGTTVHLVVEHPAPARATYVVECTIPNRPIVRNSETWEMSERRVDDLTPRPQIFGQHEIADLAEDPARRTALIERFVVDRPERERAMGELQAGLAESREAIGRCMNRVARLEERLSLLPAAEERLDLFKRAGVADRLSEQVMLDRELRTIRAGGTRLDELARAVTEFEAATPLERVTDDQTESSPLRGDLEKIDSVLGVASAEATTAVETVQQAIDVARAEVESIFQKWKTRRAAADASLQKVKDELKDERVDAEEFRRIREEVDELTALKADLKPARERETTLLRERREAIAEREQLGAERLADFRKAAARVSNELSPHVRVTVDASIDYAAMEGIVREHAPGRLAEAFALIRRDASFSPLALADAIRAGSGEITKRWGVSAAQAATLAALPADATMRLEEVALNVRTSISLNVNSQAGQTNWQDLERLSKGQRAIAVLLLLLLDAESPLVVDQPEDDLDNLFISERVVPAVRRTKTRRQFVFSTHNANVPVLADAELIIGLTATGDVSDGGVAEVRPEHLGAIDKPSVRALIEERLEGGHAAFEERRRKYALGHQ